MRTKEEILKDCAWGLLKEPLETQIKHRQLEVLIDIRDLLNLLVHPEYKVTSEGKVEKIKK